VARRRQREFNNAGTLSAGGYANWREASEEILDGPKYFPPLDVDAGAAAATATALVISSSPLSGGSTRSRIVFQTLVSAARKSIYITTPYFLPDQACMTKWFARGSGASQCILSCGAGATTMTLSRFLWNCDMSWRRRERRGYPRSDLLLLDGSCCIFQCPSRTQLAGVPPSGSQAPER